MADSSVSLCFALLEEFPIFPTLSFKSWAQYIELDNVLSFLLDSTTNRLEDDIRKGEGAANMQSTFFLSPSLHEIGLSGGKEEGSWRARESDYEAR
ncbi:hypothetical protein ALC62_06428 [Cyphomyrmex costatus]|uniref:Uncharacterized protein n=1 Tax=Cyphomyrmex costatus TaxID=456900 RepID=A0A195CR94_9HYME|nr:hypothetical protein ALC62_06428 [Cyphomyrmex costatus]